MTQRTLVETLEATLRLLHPFMPFITEEIWQRLPHEGESIMVAPLPEGGRVKAKRARRAADAAGDRLVSAIRAIRSESRISPGAELAVTVKPAARARRRSRRQPR